MLHTLGPSKRRKVDKTEVWISPEFVLPFSEFISSDYLFGLTHYVLDVCCWAKLATFVKILTVAGSPLGSQIFGFKFLQDNFIGGSVQVSQVVDEEEEEESGSQSSQLQPRRLFTPLEEEKRRQQRQLRQRQRQMSGNCFTEQRSIYSEAAAK